MEDYSIKTAPVLSNYGHSCYQCAKGTKDAPLQRCSNCARVFYCGAECQKLNWPKHKAVCKALKTMETKDGTELLEPYKILSALGDQGVGNLEVVNDCISSVAAVEARVLAAELGYPLGVEERNLIGWQPRCLACGRSNLILRVEAASAPSTSTNTAYKSLKSCEDCLLSFSCSPEHWNIAQPLHQDFPCADGIGLGAGGQAVHSQCVMNAHALQDLRFSQFMAGANSGPFKWAPERTKERWTPLRGGGADGNGDAGWREYETDIRREFGRSADVMMEPMLRAVTEGLSMPMTVLWALENLNTDDSWTRKGELTIHVIGAADIELTNSNLFEEILHRLPEVKVINMIFCGPDLLKISGAESVHTEMETCPQCVASERKRVYEYHPKTYHEYIAACGAAYAPPDLAVAFNSGCSQEAALSWSDTIAALVERHIPSVFTAYNEEEAQAESGILEGAGAELHTDLGPSRNPWGSLQAKTEPNRVTGYYMVNGWLAGGFR